MNCRICGGILSSLGSVPFDRNNANVPIVNDNPMEYHKCTYCKAISCQEMLDWTPEMLGTEVYNDDYIKYDPDYTGVRPLNYADYLNSVFKKGLSHLDYGSGSGIMVEFLNKHGWKNSISYDPYSNNIIVPGTYKLISAVEVFEHSLDLDATIKDMKKYLHRDGVIIFSTLTVPDIVDISWWYIGARNGHINIQSKESLKILAKENNLFYHSITNGMHVMQPARSNFKNMLKNG